MLWPHALPGAAGGFVLAAPGPGTGFAAPLFRFRCCFGMPLMYPIAIAMVRAGHTALWPVSCVRLGAAHPAHLSTPPLSPSMVVAALSGGVVRFVLAVCLAQLPLFMFLSGVVLTAVPGIGAAHPHSVDRNNAPQKAKLTVCVPVLTKPIFK